MSSIYVSSTYADLEKYRLTVIGTLRRMNHHVVCMEDYGAADQRPLHKCLKDVEACDVYVGLFAWRYGFVPTHDNPAGRSITELEYRHAHELGKTCLIFLLDTKQPWPPNLIDIASERERLDALRAELSKRYLVGFFGTEGDLAGQVATAIHNYTAQSPKREEGDGKNDLVPRPPIASGLQRSFLGHSGPVECVAFSADGRMAASGSWDKSIRVWDLAMGRMLTQLNGHTGTIAHPGIVHRVLFRETDRQIISCGYDGTIRIWDISGSLQVRRLAGHEGGVTALALAADERVLVSGGADRIVRVWDVASYRQTMQLSGHRGQVRSVAISNDGRLAISGGTDGQLRLWDLVKGSEIPRFGAPGNILLSVDIAPDGSLALSADIDGTIRLWDVEAGREVRTFLGHSNSVRSAVMSRDLRRMLSASNDNTMRMWDLSSGEQIECYNDHKCAVTTVALSRDGMVALSGAADNLVRLWRLPQEGTN
jgi:WD40 repeat protein